jgi:hypothetical protein
MLVVHIVVSPRLGIAGLLEREDDRQVCDGRVVGRTRRVVRGDHDTVAGPKLFVLIGACLLLDGGKELCEIAYAGVVETRIITSRK